MGIVGPGVVASRNRIQKGKKTSARTASLLQLRQQLGPLVLQHGFKPLPGNVARTGAVQVVADFLVVGRDGFGDGAGGAAYDQEPARDFLSGANFGERTESGRIEVQGERFLVSVHFFSRRHSYAPVKRTDKKHDLNLSRGCARPRSSYRSAAVGRYSSFASAPGKLLSKVAVVARAPAPDNVNGIRLVPMRLKASKRKSTVRNEAIYR